LYNIHRVVGKRVVERLPSSFLIFSKKVEKVSKLA
jgi:hypothetical protein